MKGSFEMTGLAARMLTSAFFRLAEVVENQTVATDMHLITLQGAALRDLHWAPGDKLQVRLGTGLLTRTYTPIHWDPAKGSTQILAHSLAVGPGSEWVRRASPGQSVWLFGPRRSLALSDVDPQTGVLVGDETAVGLAAAWNPAHVVIEANNAPSIQHLLDSMGLRRTATVVQRDGLRLDVLASEVLRLASPGRRFVLVGRAGTVQYLRRAMRESGVASNRILTKAYWADGKSGLD